MAINGTLTFPDVPGRISEHNSSTTAHSTRIENNLTNPTEGKAADAKATKDLVENVSGQIEEEIDALNDEVTDLKSAIDDIDNVIYTKTSVTCTLANGSVSNPNNENSVHTSSAISCKGGDVVTILPVRKNTSGYYYVYAYVTYDKSNNVIENVYDASTDNQSVFISSYDVTSIKFSIFEYDGSSYNPLRSTTYGASPVCVVTSYNIKDDLTFIKNEISKISPINIPVSVFNGTVSNRLNSNAVNTSMVKCKNGDTVVFNPVRPNTSGYYYLYGYRVYDSDGATIVDVITAAEDKNVVVISNASAESIRFFWVESNGSSYNPLRSNTYEYTPLVIVYDGTTTTEKFNSDIKSINQIVKNDNFLNDCVWKVGSLDSGIETNTTNRIRTEFIEIGYSEKFELNVNAGYLYAITFYDVNKKFISSSSSWQTANVVITRSDFNGASYLRVVLRNTNNATMNVTDKSNISGKMIRFSNYVTEHIDEKIENVSPNSINYYNDLLSQARFSPNLHPDQPHSANILTLLHFSDVHNDFNAMQKALEIYDTYSEKIDDVIHTGDVVLANWSDGIGNWIDSGCAETVISVVGNHDSENNLILGTAGKTNVYNGMLAPYIGNWDVVQPTGVDDSTSPHYCACYYYKDYDTAKIRLIVLDTNWWDDYQKSWLDGVLDDSLTNEYSVVIACHTPLRVTGIIESNFCSYTEPIINEPSAYANIPNNWLDPVDDFITAGGEVICMLSGHNHRDHIGYLTDYPDVLCITADKASVNRTIDTARINGEENATAHNAITFNTTDKWIKIVRFGAEVDGAMRGKHVFCYDYANKSIISQW